MTATAVNTWLLSGIPRSASSLCCRLASALPNVVALVEPMQQDLFDGGECREAACQRILDFASEARVRIRAAGRAPSVQIAGELDDNMVAPQPSGGLRRRRASQGEIPVHKPLSSDFTLLIKHNALFAALLPKLAQSFRCFALVRNPVAVLASWQTVDLPVNGGRLPAGERFDPALHGVLSSEPDVLRRQIIILNWFFASFKAHVAHSNVIRYEDLVGSGGMALFRLIGGTGTSPVALENHNGSSLYRSVDLDALLAALAKEGGAWSAFYSAAECAQVADKILCSR